MKAELAQGFPSAAPRVVRRVTPPAMPRAKRVEPAPSAPPAPAPGRKRVARRPVPVAPKPMVGEMERGAVYSVRRSDRSGTDVAVYTGDKTGSGRLRFEAVDRLMTEKRHFALSRGRVIAKLAPSLAAYLRGLK